jgi:hypothetical protein
MIKTTVLLEMLKNVFKKNRTTCRTVKSKSAFPYSYFPYEKHVLLMKKCSQNHQNHVMSMSQRAAKNKHKTCAKNHVMRLDRADPEISSLLAYAVIQNNTQNCSYLATEENKR